MKAKRVGLWLLAALVLVCPTMKAQEGPLIRVPEGNGRPILIDGIFTPGEWDDAVKVELKPGVQLQIRQAKFASDEWRVRLRTYKVEDETWDFHPRGTDTASTAGWFRLLMK